jgi:hypothetical protein
LSSSEPTPTASKANLFDLRRIIGGLFIVYGLLLTILGLFDSQKEIDKAAGVNINLWAGLGMLVVGGLFMLWAFTRPLSEELGHEQDEDEGFSRPGAPAPRGPDIATLTSQQRGTRPGRDDDAAGDPVDPRPE